MAGTADVPDELMAWWRTFNNGIIVEEEDSDSEGEEEPEYDREDEEAGEEGASAAATAPKVDQQMTADAARPEKESSGGAVLHGNDADDIPEEDVYVEQLQAGLLGSKREVVATGSKPQDVGVEIQDAAGEEEIPEGLFGLEGIGVDQHGLSWINSHKNIERREEIMTRSKQQAALSEVQDGKGKEIPGDTSVQLQGEMVGVGRREEAKITRSSKMRVIRTENHNQKEGRVSEYTCAEPEGGLRGRKRKATVTPPKLQTTGIEIKEKKCDGECLTAENEMLRLKLNLNVKNKEIKSLKKQIGELRAELYRKNAKLRRKPRLCGFCNEYVLGHNSATAPRGRDGSSGCSTIYRGTTLQSTK